MSVKIKVCGLAERDSYEAVAKLRPDYLGHIFYEPSPRYLAPAMLAEWPKPPDVPRVGVFVNASAEHISGVAHQTQLDAVQLHGDETPALCKSLRRRFPTLTIIKTVALIPGFDWQILPLYAVFCDYFLCDTPARGVQKGGTGCVFDWNLLHEGTWPRPFFLAGGLSAANVDTALRACAGLPLHALDVNSRVEIAPGIKSTVLVNEFIAQVSQLKNELSS